MSKELLEKIIKIANSGSEKVDLIEKETVNDIVKTIFEAYPLANTISFDWQSEYDDSGGYYKYVSYSSITINGLSLDDIPKGETKDHLDRKLLEEISEIIEELDIDMFARVYGDYITFDRSKV